MDILLPNDFEREDAPKVLDNARPILELPPDAKLRVENVTQTTRGTRIDFSYTRAITLDDDSLDDVAGIKVDRADDGAERLQLLERRERRGFFGFAKALTGEEEHRRGEPCSAYSSRQASPPAVLRSILRAARGWG